uniref:Heat shock protein, alpha-crystallin-related, b3 n=2 Tax=Callorhinchus milii TaxID=7868 RepID=A0A4W3K8A7_CALMI
MEEGIVRHWINTPVRYQHKIVEQDLVQCKLDHSLFALPGPAQRHREKDKLSSEDSAELAEPNKEEIPFEIMLDVVQFRPEDIMIQVFEGWLLIRAQHRRRMDEHGFISRSFTRQYKLSDGLEAKDLSAVFCHDGILVVKIKA